MFVLFSWVVFIQEMEIGSSFPTICQATVINVMTTCRNVSWAGYNGSYVSQSGYIWFQPGLCDQESTNGNPWLVDWSLRVYINTSYFWLQQLLQVFVSSVLLMLLLWYWILRILFISCLLYELFLRFFLDATHWNIKNTDFVVYQ